MERIDELRLDALDAALEHDDFCYKFYKAYDASSAESDYERYAEAIEYALGNLTPYIHNGELIVGRCKNLLSDEEKGEWNEKYREIAAERSRVAGPGQDSHMAIDYELLLSLGISGIVEKIDGYIKNAEGESLDFYKCCKRSLMAVVSYAKNYSAVAKRLAENEKNEQRAAELLEISEIMSRVPLSPAESFYEAVESVHFITHVISMNPLRALGAHQFQLGHPDRYLYPYYERDIKSGKITRERAQLLLDCLGIQINNRVPRGLSSGYMVGGRDEDGNVVDNELTRMLMQVIDDVSLVYPAVGLCYTDGTSDETLKLACEILAKGRSHPAIFNDEVISRGLMYYGLTEREARSYIHSTCVEITPVASSNVWVASPYTNLPKILLDTMTREYASLDEHLCAFYELLDDSIRKNAEQQKSFRENRAKNSMEPILSCFVNDCLQKGVDIDRGGARYNWIMPSFVGMANLVDSLYALKVLVYDTREYTVCGIKDILDRNFEGAEPLRARINALPKYGNDNDEIDAYFGIIVSHIIDECKKHTGIHTHADIIPSVFCWIMHERFGAETGATPDGRVAGFPLGDGSGPCQGREMCGPTASIISSTKWEHEKLIGGVAVNMKFAKSSLGPSSIDTMSTLIRTYIERGGFEMQINVVDKATLIEAKKNPDAYRDLVVRIGGYSDYFTRLSPSMQDEVILRTAHSI
ncbi:MAG: hypothetical protein IJW03_00025 [Clostridia bacterium]|nr:hypothetical protein [Clostridia bacterium]